MTIKQQGGVFGRNPTFNDVEVQSLTIAGNAVPDASTILVDGDIGSTVQAYDADTAKLDVVQTFNASQTFTSAVNIEAAGEPQLNLQIGGLTYGNFRLDSGDLVIGTGAVGIKFYDFDSAVAPATATTGGLVNNSLDLGSSSFNWRNAYIGTSVVMANGAGIDFSATSGTGTSELFDDYEEGTFTPSLGGTTSDPTISYASQTGKYTKIGRLVHCEITIIISSFSGGSGNLQLEGLPFASDGDDDRGCLYVGFSANWASGVISGISDVSATTVSLRKFDANNNQNTPVLVTDASGDEYLRCCITYHAA